MTFASSSNGDPRYDVEISGTNAADILARQASRAGIGREFVAAFRAVIARLRRDPNHFGEPLYRLPTMRLQVRCAVIRPLVVDFAVSEERPEVYIKSVKLL
jgi:hypothetical protein